MISACYPSHIEANTHSQSKGISFQNYFEVKGTIRNLILPIWQLTLLGSGFTRLLWCIAIIRMYSDN